MVVTELLHKFQSTPAMQESCQEIYCTTCGGKAASILRARHEYIQPVKDALANAGLEGLASLGPWISVVLEIAPAALEESLIKVTSASDSYGVGDLEKFILLSSKYTDISPRFHEAYSTCLLKAQEIALRTQEASLLETLILSMGVEMLNAPELLSVALSKRDDPRVAKALYNKLREHVPEVRGYRVSAAGT
jgi:hypothetical protein